MNRTVILIVVLVALGAVSAFMWTSQEKVETEKTITQTAEVFTCTKCGNEFSLTIDESTEMYQKNAGITCPKCNELGANKRDAKIIVGGLGGSNEEEATEDENAPKEAVGGVRSIKDK